MNSWTSVPQALTPPTPMGRGRFYNAHFPLMRAGSLSHDETHAATPKGNLKREAALSFQKRHKLSVCALSPDPHSQTEVGTIAITKHARNQFRATLDAKLYKDIAEMKLHGLLADLQTRSDRGIRQTFGAAQGHLRLSAAEISNVNHAPDRARERMRPMFAFHALRVSRQPHRAATLQNLLGRENQIDRGRLMIPVGAGHFLSLDAELVAETRQSAPHGAVAANTCQTHQPAGGKRSDARAHT